MNFPEFYTPNCPLNEAKNGDSTNVYRLAREIGDNNDFLCWYLHPKKKHILKGWKEKNDLKKLCHACGLSVYKDRKDVEELRKDLPFFRNNDFKIIRGEIKKESGKYLESPRKERPSHTTWWIFNDIPTYSLFWYDES
ncbi:MAG: hypothetical protein K8R40_04680 [Anaerolineaceae bacterium]|nr:hypothetical protein [Anaerolineaceae bacterium]